METNVASLLSLNDDCLYVIFKHLEIQDQTNLASCCCRLRDVFVMRMKVEHRILDLNDMETLSSWQIQKFFQMAGPHVENLICLSPCNQSGVLDLVGLYCTNVKSISLSRQYLPANRLRKLFKNTHLVEVLNLDDVELKDEGIPVLKKLKKLKKISLEKNYALTGREMKCLTTVHDLSLNGCKSIAPNFFEEICANLTDLKYLDIQECYSLNAHSMLDIVKHLRQLQTIKLSFDNNQIGCIATLPCLKNVHLCGGVGYSTVHAKIFKELAKHKADQLEILAIPYAIDLERVTSISELTNLKELICPFNDKLNDNCLQHLSKLHNLELLDVQNCISFTASGLVDLIQKCTKLTTLNISHCVNLDEKFATKVLELLISEKKHRNQIKPLKLIASKSGIQRSAVESPAFKDASDILSILFVFDLDDSYIDDCTDFENEGIDDSYSDQDDGDGDCDEYFNIFSD